MDKKLSKLRLFIMVIFGVLVGYGIGMSFDTTDRGQLWLGYSLSFVSVVVGVILFIYAGIKRCPRCDKRLSRGTRICGFCGRKLVDVE